MRQDEPEPVPDEPVLGIVLAAGAGTRFGMPKALARADDGTPWLDLACRALFDGGCADVVVVLGARAEEAAPLVPARATSVIAAGWATGIASSLRSGLASAAASRADAAVITLVDLPGLRADAVRRVLGSATGRGPLSDPLLGAAAVSAPDPALGSTADPAPGVVRARLALARATYGGKPGHPVLVGSAHWPALAAEVHGDTGAGPYLRAHGAVAVDCTDLGGGDDVDRRT